MKIFMLFMLCISSSCFAQDSTSNKRPKTQIEDLITKSGVILKKDYKKIAEIRGVTIELLTVTSNQSTSIKGLRISGIGVNSLYNSSRAYSVFLDQDELDDFITFLNLTKETLEMQEPPNKVEYVYNTKGDFQGFIYNNISAYGNLWHYGFDLNRGYSGGSFEFKEKDIDKIIEAFKWAKSLL